MGSKRLDSISDYSRHGFNLRVVCQGCGRAAVLDSLALSMARSKAGKVRMNIELWVRDVMLALLTEIAVREFELRQAGLRGQ